MEKIFLCSCNNCGTIYKDSNPSDDAIEVSLPADIVNDIPAIGKDILGTICPRCSTSEYLSDHWYNVSDWFTQITRHYLHRETTIAKRIGAENKAKEIKQALYIFEKL